jgi:hypothetical protein
VAGNNHKRNLAYLPHGKQTPFALENSPHRHSFTSSLRLLQTRVGSGILFRKNSAEWTRNGFRYPQKNVLIPRHSEVYGTMEESIPTIGTEGNDMKFYKKILLQQIVLTACFLPRHALERNSERLAISSNLRLLLTLFYGTKFRVGFSSAEWFGTEFQVFASIFVSRYRIPNIFLLCGVVRNGIPRVSCSAEQPEFRWNKPVVPSIPSSAE